MKINFKDSDIKKIITDIDFEKHSIKEKDNKHNLTNYQIDILEKHNINYNKASSISEIIYLINLIFEEDDNYELENILEELSERNYYENTKK